MDPVKLCQAVTWSSQQKRISQQVKATCLHDLVRHWCLQVELLKAMKRNLLVDCNAEGVLFTEAEADADISLEQLSKNVKPSYPFFHEVLYNVPGSM